MALISLCSLAKRRVEFPSVVNFVIHLFLLEWSLFVCEEEVFNKTIRAFVNSTV